MRHLLSVLLLSLLHACSDFDAERMFVSHVTIIEQDKIHELRGGKVSCLHCPMYFMFDAEPTLVAKIIADHQLLQIHNASQEIRSIEELVRRQARQTPTLHG